MARNKIKDKCRKPTLTSWPTKIPSRHEHTTRSRRPNTANITKNTHRCPSREAWHDTMPRSQHTTTRRRKDKQRRLPHNTRRRITDCNTMQLPHVSRLGVVHPHPDRCVRLPRAGPTYASPLTTWPDFKHAHQCVTSN